MSGPRWQKARMLPWCEEARPYADFELWIDAQEAAPNDSDVLRPDGTIEGPRVSHCRHLRTNLFGPALEAIDIAADEVELLPEFCDHPPREDAVRALAHYLETKNAAAN